MKLHDIVYYMMYYYYAYYYKLTTLSLTLATCYHTLCCDCIMIMLSVGLRFRTFVQLIQAIHGKFYVNPHTT